MYLQSIEPRTKIDFKGRYEHILDSIDSGIDKDAIIPEYDDIDFDKETYRMDSQRTEELFDRGRGDKIDYFYRNYGDYNDLHINNDRISRFLSNDEINYSQYIDTDIDTRTQYMRRPVIYTAANALQLGHESFQTRLNEGFSREEISAIYNSALVNKGVDYKNSKCMDLKLAKDGFEFLKTGTDLKVVTNTMKNSKIARADGATRYVPELFLLLTQYPYARNCVVEKPKRTEYFRSDVAAIYPELRENCEQKSDVYRIIRSCRLYEKEQINRINIDMCKLALKIVKNEHEWSDMQNRVLFSVIKRNRYESINPKMYNIISQLVEEGYPSLAILRKIKK